MKTAIAEKEAFQYLYGAVKSLAFAQMSSTGKYFNTYMMRLKVNLSQDQKTS